jgi:serine-type D-Ala-D-Ala endopeptidase (penicillin-binding protein 7)
MPRILLTLFLLACAGAASALPLGSQYALVVEEETGKVLYEKNATNAVPIASLTKLMTAMVVLDTKPDLEMPVRIEASDVDTLKHTSSHVPVGATLPLKSVLQLALMASDNRAAAALCRTYPGGRTAFLAAVHVKLAALGMTSTTIEEPTGLSSKNTSTAADLARMAHAASHYPDIVRVTTAHETTLNIKGRKVRFHNTNKLVGSTGWENIRLSKTGFTRAAGKCIIMKIKTGDKNVIVVLLNARASSVRSTDVVKVRHFVTVVRASLA